MPLHSSPLVNRVPVPVLIQACLREPRDSFGTPKGPATGLPGVVHIGAHEWLTKAAEQARRGQRRASTGARRSDRDGRIFPASRLRFRSCCTRQLRNRTRPPPRVRASVSELLYSATSQLNPSPISATSPCCGFVGAISHCSTKVTMKNRQFFARLVTVSPLLVAGVAQAQSADPATALAALSSLSGTTVAYGPVMFGLAITAVAIMIGIAWIKKGKSAAS